MIMFYVQRAPVDFLKKKKKETFIMAFNKKNAFTKHQ